MIETESIYEDRELLTYKDGRKSTAPHHIVREVPLTIVLNGEELTTLVCSPHSFELLAIGYLVSEGILQHHDQLKSIVSRPEQRIVWVSTVDSPARADAFLKERFASWQGKGKPLGRSHHESEPIQPVSQKSRFTVKALLGFIALLDEKAKTFRLTGGVHEAALAHGESFVAWYEDIGRHNALDRILGHTFLNQIDTSDKAVVLSGRVASEMLAKVARIGVPIVVSRSAPTCMSIDLAEQLGITIVGFARGNSLNVYTHPYRVIE